MVLLNASFTRVPTFYTSTSTRSFLVQRGVCCWLKGCLLFIVSLSGQDTPMERERERERERVPFLRLFNGARNLIFEKPPPSLLSSNTSDSCPRLCRCRSSSLFSPFFFFRFLVDEHSSAAGSRVRGAKEKKARRSSRQFSRTRPFFPFPLASSLRQTLAPQLPARLCCLIDKRAGWIGNARAYPVSALRRVFPLCIELTRAKASAREFPCLWKPATSKTCVIARYKTSKAAIVNS